MKIIAIGDIHGNPLWKQVIEQEKDADLFVFIGDYFDSFVYKTEQQINNFLDIISYKEANPGKVVMLIGNHDLHYITGDTGTSGFQTIGSFQICPVIEANRQHLQMAYGYGGIIFSHAGISKEWLEEESFDFNSSIVDFVNELFKYKPNHFVFNGVEQSGDDLYQTPVWIRPVSLMKSNYTTLRNQFIQVVGHTQMKCIDIKGNSTGGRYYFIDTLNTNKEYLIITDEVFSSKQVKE